MERMERQREIERRRLRDRIERSVAELERRPTLSNLCTVQDLAEQLYRDAYRDQGRESALTATREADNG